ASLMNLMDLACLECLAFTSSSSELDSLSSKLNGDSFSMTSPLWLLLCSAK
ncbi:predicted protein, partial [Nematostella vectensis]